MTRLTCWQHCLFRYLNKHIMRYTLFTVLFLLAFISPIQAQEEHEVLGRFFKVGVVNVETLADFDVRSVMQIEAVADKARAIAKKLNQLVRRDKVIKSITICERGRDGVPVLTPQYDEDGGDPTKMISLFIALPESLFEEEIILKMYKYGITIPKEVEWSHPEYHQGAALLERIGIASTRTDCPSY